MKKIKEIIVVEGRDDVTAVKAAVDAEMIIVNGFAVHNKATLEKIKAAHERTGVIVLTDPDFAGDRIRQTIENYVPGVKHAYIGRKEGTREKDGNVGIENAKPDVIIEALSKAKFKLVDKVENFIMADLIDCGMTGGSEAKEKRQKVGIILGIGYANAKQFLSKLNHFGVTREEFEAALEEAEKK